MSKRTKRTKLRPEQTVGEKEKLDRHWRGLFLDTLAETSNVSAAARRAGINPARAYKVRRVETQFAREWGKALLEGYQHLEMELLGYLRDRAPTHKMDTGAALRLLGAHRETVARERARRSWRSEESVLEELQERFDRLCAQEEDVQRILIEDGTALPDAHGRD